MLLLPPALIPAGRGLPGCGWVLARAFTPAWAAAALVLPYTAQLAAAHALGGLATHRNDQSRAVAILRPATRAHQIMLGLGALAGVVVLYALLLAAALAFLEVFDVRSLIGATPAYLLVVWPAAAGLVLGWGARHNLGRRPRHPAGGVRIGSLAAQPPGKHAGTELGQKLCDLADAQQVTLDLTARTDTLVGFYARAGFTQPDPGTRWMIRHPVPQPRRGRLLP